MKMMKMKRKILLLFLTVLLSVLTVSCGKTQEAGGAAEEGTDGTPLSYDHSMELDYAQGFAVDYYDGGYALITISDGSRFLSFRRVSPCRRNCRGMRWKERRPQCLSSRQTTSIWRPLR